MVKLRLVLVWKRSVCHPRPPAGWEEKRQLRVAVEPIKVLAQEGERLAIATGMCSQESVGDPGCDVVGVLAAVRVVLGKGHDVTIVGLALRNTGNHSVQAALQQTVVRPAE